MGAPRNKARIILLLFACSAVAQEQAIFRAGTRLVEVDVVVRDKNGHVRGLTKDDFTLFDCKASERSVPRPFSPCKGKRQPLDVFREIDTPNSPGAPPAAPAISLAPGVFSNRVYSDGKPLASATILIFDQLNTPFNLKGYERLSVVKFLQSAGAQNRIALYSLGADLHILQDFTDDPKKLIDAVAKVDSGDQLNPATSDTPDDPKIAALEGEAVGDAKREVTVAAIKKIIQHMEGVPGRKNLVWVGQGFGAIFNPPFGPPEARNLLGAANIAVYPVMVRSIMGSPGGIAESRGLPPSPGIGLLAIQDSFRKFAQTLGGSGFTDATEIQDAVTAAEEDSNNYYVLGFYPAEKDLDGGTHQLTLEVSKRVAKRPDVVLTYRQVYLAAKLSSAPPPGSGPPASGPPGSSLDDRPSVGDLFRSPLDATAIGLTGAIVADPAKPGARRIQATVDLAGIQLRHEDGRFVGSFQMSTRFEYKEADVLMVTPPIIQTVSVSLTDAEFAAIRASGYLVIQQMPEGLKPGTAHIVVQDAANGASGSLRIPMPGNR